MRLGGDLCSVCLFCSPQRFSQASQLWAAAAFDYETRLLQISHGRTTEFEGAGVF